MAKRGIAEAAQAIRARKNRTPPKDKTPAVKPTEQRELKNPSRSAGMARRIIPVIETLLKNEQITQDEFDALKHYREQASLAETSLTRSCCAENLGGSGNGPGIQVISARIETARIENHMGIHMALARAVCRDDMSLTQWCIERYGGRERYRNGKVVEIRPKGNGHVSDALAQLKKAAAKVWP